MKNRNTIFCLGHNSIDIFIHRNDLGKLRIGGSFESQNLKIFAGGDSANVAFWLGKLGMSVSFIGVIGNDPLGTFLKTELESVNVNCHLKITNKFPTALILTIIECDGERSFIVNGKCQDDLEWSDLPLKEIMSGSLFYTSAYAIEKEPIKSTIIQLFKYFNREKEHPEIMFNLASYTTVEKCRNEIISELLPHVNLLVGNRDEFTKLVRNNSVNLYEIGRRLLGDFPSLKLILITDGENGCYLISRDHEEHVPALKISAVDTTGAGDGFCAGFITEYLSGKKGYEAVRKGLYLGSNICKGYGARYFDLSLKLQNY